MLSVISVVKSREVESTEYVGDPPTYGVDDDSLAAIGWDRVNGEIFCETCLEEMNEEEE